jgi:hypothetical protein
VMRGNRLGPALDFMWPATRKEGRHLMGGRNSGIRDEFDPAQQYCPVRPRDRRRFDYGARAKLWERIVRNSSIVAAATFKTHAPAWRTTLPGR